MQTGIAASTIISTLCGGNATNDACATAQTNLVSNTVCLNALEGDDIDAICDETCLNLYSAFALSCSGSVS